MSDIVIYYIIKIQRLNYCLCCSARSDCGMCRAWVRTQAGSCQKSPWEIL